MKTNWDAYYSKPYKTAKYSRKIMENLLLKLIRQYAPSGDRFSLAEFGGGNSCFFDQIQTRIAPSLYTVIDNNQIGIEKFKTRAAAFPATQAMHADILNLDLNNQFDVVFSVGLIEHFNPQDTAIITRKHFEATKPGGTVIITFPTPTFLYKITRFCAEKLGLWIFHDERPLLPPEVIKTAAQYGEIMYKKTVWPIFLTQHVIAVKKHGSKDVL